MELNYVQLFLELLLLSLVGSSGDLYVGVAWCAVVCVLAPHPACIRYKVRPARLVGGENGRKFAMLGLLVAKTVESSPCARKTREIGHFWASRASFVPRMR